MDEKIPYDKMYRIMFNAAEDAMQLLIKAQQACEELYMVSAHGEEYARTEEEKKIMPPYGINLQELRQAKAQREQAPKEN